MTTYSSCAWHMLNLIVCNLWHGHGTRMWIHSKRWQKAFRITVELIFRWLICCAYDYVTGYQSWMLLSTWSGTSVTLILILYKFRKLLPWCSEVVSIHKFHNTLLAHTQNITILHAQQIQKGFYGLQLSQMNCFLLKQTKNMGRCMVSICTFLYSHSK